LRLLNPNIRAYASRTVIISLSALFAICLINCLPALALERKSEWTVSAAGYIWCGTEAGLFQFDAVEETWSRAQAVDIPVEEVKLWDGSLWLGGIGVMTADSELGDWLRFTSSTGLPGDHYRALEFGDEYYWIATDSGAARYDPILEEWERLSGADIQFNDLAVAGRYVFFAGDGQIYRFDREYENGVFLDSTDGISGGRYRWIEELPGELWFIGEEAIDIYSTDSRSWTSIPSAGGCSPGEIEQIFNDGDRLWILTDDEVKWCYWRGRDFQPFPREDRLAGYRIREIAGSGGVYYFATDRGLLIYYENEEKWELIDQSIGLENNDLMRAAVVSQLVFLRSNQMVQIYSLSARRFLPSLILKDMGAVSKSGRRWSWDQRGLGGGAAGGDVRLKGNYSYIRQWEEADFLDRHRTQLYPAGKFSGRQASGFYDNTDLDKIIYGASFRGLREDNLRRAEYGNRVNYTLNNSRLLGETTVEGVQSVIEFGSRSPLRGRRAFKLEGTYGTTAAYSASDIFFGQGDILYALSHGDLLPGSAKVFINGEEIPRTDYILSNITGTLNFAFPGSELLDENDKIQVDYQYLLPEEGGIEFAGGDLTLSQGDNFNESFSYYATDTLNAGRLAGEIRCGSGGSDFRFIPEAAFSRSDTSGEGISGRGRFYGKTGNWLLSGGHLFRDAEFNSFDPALTEFGGLRRETAAQLGYEAGGFAAYADYSFQAGEYGEENTYKVKGFYSQSSNLSLFTKAAVRIADGDSLQRGHREMNFGGNFILDDNALNILNFRRFEIYSEMKLSATDREYPLNQDSAQTQIDTRSLYLRMMCSPSGKVNLTPELRLIDKIRAVDGADSDPFIGKTMFRGTGNVLDALPGVRHYFRWNGEYNRDKFAFGKRDVYLYKEGYFSTEFLPGRWREEFSSFNFGLTFYRSERDSLKGVNDDFTELWGEEGEYSFFTGSDILRVTVFPAADWEFTEVMTSSEGESWGITSRRFQSQSTVWWKGDNSQVAARFYYTLDRALAQTVTYNPNIEWHYRWSKGFLTRFSMAGTYKDEESGDEIYIAPSVYFDRYFGNFLRNGAIQLRNDFRPSYRKTTGIYKIRQAGLANALNIDIKLSGKFIFRLISSYEYTFDLEAEEGDSNLETEVRATVKF